MHVRSERGLGIFQLEAPAKGEAQREVNQVVAIAKVGSDSNRKCTVQWKAFAVVHDPGAEVAADQEAGTARPLRVRDAGPKTEVVGPATVAVESFESIAEVLAGIGESGAKLVSLEGTIRSLEHRRARL